MNEGDGEGDRVVGYIIAAAAAMLVLPAMIPKVRDAVAGWLLDHRVLVAPEQALFEVPFLGAGLDVRRLVIVVVLAGLVFAASRHRVAERPSRKGASRG